MGRELQKTNFQKKLVLSLVKKQLTITLLLSLVLFAHAFAGEKYDKEYYVNRYQNEYQLSSNLSSLYRNDEEFINGIKNGFIDVNFKYEEGRTLLFGLLKEFLYEPETFIKYADFLIENGADVNIADDEGFTLLLYAVNHINNDRDYSIIEYLLKNKADVKVVSKEGDSIINFLCQDSKPDIKLINDFIKRGAPLNAVREYGFTPLTAALYRKKIEAAKLLIESNADVNLKDGDDRYPINLACETGDFELVKLMVSKGAKINVADKSGYTPLHYAVEYGSNENIDLVKFLVEKGAKVNVSTESGYTPLIVAGWEEKTGYELIKYLVSRKANINAKTKDGYNVGMACSKFINLDCFKFLEANGFNFKAVDKEGNSVLHYFVSYHTCSDRDSLFYYASFANEDEDFEPVIKFLAKKIGIDAQTRDKETALHIACSSIIDYTPIVKALIKNGADVNAKDEYGRTPIFNCGVTPEMVQLLIDSGADLSVKNKYGKTVLDYYESAVKNNPSVSKVIEILQANITEKKEYSFVQLVEYNYADKAIEYLKKTNLKEIDDYDEKGYTPLYYAVVNKNLELAKMLLDKGCDINKKQKKEDITVLYYVVSKTDLDMFKLLMKYKPDLSMEYKKSYSDYIVNILYPVLYPENVFNNERERYEIAKSLLQAGADPNFVIDKSKGFTITSDCCLSSNEDLIELFIEYGGNPFSVWSSYIYSDRMEFSIIRRNVYGDSIDYENRNAVYRGLVKQLKDKTLVATDNLRLRSGYGTTYSTITAIKKGTKVKVLDADNMEIIDRIHSCWVKVEVLPGGVDSEGKKIAAGTQGWCFLGYLEVK